MKKRFKLRYLLFVLGAALILYALISMLGTDDMWTYAIVAPDVQTTVTQDTQSIDSGLEKLVRQRDSVAEKLGEEVRALTCGGQTPNADISSERTVEGQISLYAVDVCWLEVHPQRLLYGRWMDNTELRAGTRVAVVDSRTAFALFGTEDCIGSRFRIGDREYRIVGVTEKSAGLGETGEYRIYIPLLAASDQGIQLESLELSALPLNRENLGTSFETAAREAWGEGSYYCVRREVTGHTMLLRWMAFLAGMLLVSKLFHVWRGRTCERISQIREMCRLKYIYQVLRPVLLKILAMILGAVALLGAVYGLLVFMIQPVYTFTEWVPESLVAISSYSEVFLNLTRTASAAVTVRTADIARLTLLGRFLNWGCILLLLSMSGYIIRLPKSIEAKQ